MPQRRRAAFSAGLAGVANIGETMVKQGALDRQNAVVIQRQLLDDFSSRVNKGELEPEQAELALKQQGMNVPPGFFNALAPSPDIKMRSAVEDITKASTPQQVPGGTALETMVPKRRPLMGEKPRTGQGYNEAEGVDYMRLAKVRGEKLASFDPTKVEETLPTGETRATFVPQGQLSGRSVTTGLSDAMKGTLKGEGAVAEQQARNTGGMGTLAGVEQHDKQLAGDLSPDVIRAKANAASSEASARKKAELKADMDAYGILPGQQTAVFQLADDFEKSSTEFFAREGAFRDMMGLAKNASTNPAAGIGLVFKLMKLYDPASTVREGEQNQARNTAPLVPDWLWLKYQSLLSGQGILTPEQANQFLSAGKAIYEGESKGQAQRNALYSHRAEILAGPNAAQLVVRPPAPDVVEGAKTAGQPNYRNPANVIPQGR